MLNSLFLHTIKIIMKIKFPKTPKIAMKKIIKPSETYANDLAQEFMAEIICVSHTDALFTLP